MNTSETLKAQLIKDAVLSCPHIKLSETSEMARYEEIEEGKEDILEDEILVEMDRGDITQCYRCSDTLFDDDEVHLMTSLASLVNEEHFCKSCAEIKVKGAK